MICGVGSAFVYVKNQHVESGNQKRLLETEISALKSEIAQIDRQIAAKLVHPAVERTLDDNGTALVQIPPGSVLRIDGGQEEILARNE